MLMLDYKRQVSIKQSLYIGKLENASWRAPSSFAANKTSGNKGTVMKEVRT
jgi:hypothetical protein